MIEFAYINHILILIGIWIILSVSLNMTVGFTGMLNLGHVAFFGIGAYTSALLTLAGVNFWIALPIAAILAGLFGLLIGIPTLRLRGDYLAIATLGFGEIMRAIFKNWSSVTRGPMGLPGIPRPELFGIDFGLNQNYLFLVIFFAVLTIFIINRIVSSPFGRVLKAIREDEIGAQALGKNIAKYKVIAFVVGSFFAGIGGSLFAHFITFIDPTSFILSETIIILLMVVLGGLGSITGSVLGAIILIALPEPLRFLNLSGAMVGAIRQLIFALILIIIMLFRPNGLLGEKKIGLFKNVRNKKPA